MIESQSGPKGATPTIIRSTVYRKAHRGEADAKPVKPRYFTQNILSTSILLSQSQGHTDKTTMDERLDFKPLQDQVSKSSKQLRLMIFSIIIPSELTLNNPPDPGGAHSNDSNIGPNCL